MIKQLVLPLKSIEEKSFYNFLPGQNQALVNYLQTLTSNSAAYLWGSAGCGVSHLLRATCHYWQEQGWYTLYLDLAKPAVLANLLEGAIDAVQLVAFDHIESVTSIQHQAELLFHVFNRSLQAPFAMLWAAHLPPAAISCALADLQSRLDSLLTFHVHNLIDAELMQALQHYAKQLGFKLSHDVTKFLLTHYPRDLNQLIVLLHHLDQICLQTKKHLTVPLLKKWQPTLDLMVTKIPPL